MKRMKQVFTMTAVGCGCLMLAGCATTPSVTRIQAGGPTAVTSSGVDLADFKATAGQMVKELLAHPAVSGFRGQNGRAPALNRGQIVNKSDLMLDMGQLAGRINEDLLNSGLVELVANDKGVADAAALDAWEKDVKSVKSARADFLLEGEIMLLSAKDGRLREKTYTFQLRLNDTKTRRTVWQRTVDVSKQSTRPMAGW
jgi:PBP1b-binding outer membrane lipoprotein LpoB